MLAYVFWHWPRPEIDRRTYEEDLKAFHRTLNDHKSEGFNYSSVFLIDQPNWLNTNGAVYEEWYLLDDSAAMDKLNYAAVNGACEAPHNRVAYQAEDGTGGLYRLRAGHLDLSTSQTASWIAKPAGKSYPEFYAQIGPLTSRDDAALWGRQMTLGPTTEFCIHSPNEPELPEGYDAHFVQMDLIWNGNEESS
jgi:hypothetical protein